jgi:hypothetical protein
LKTSPLVFVILPSEPIGHEFLPPPVLVRLPYNYLRKNRVFLLKKASESGSSRNSMPPIQISNARLRPCVTGTRIEFGGVGVGPDVQWTEVLVKERDPFVWLAPVLAGD